MRPRAATRPWRSSRFGFAIALPLVVGATVGSTHATAQDAFVVTGSLNDARESHAATLLADGKVLVTGQRAAQTSWFASVATPARRAVTPPARFEEEQVPGQHISPRHSSHLSILQRSKKTTTRDLKPGLVSCVFGISLTLGVGASQAAAVTLRPGDILVTDAHFGGVGVPAMSEGMIDLGTFGGTYSFGFALNGRSQFAGVSTTTGDGTTTSRLLRGMALTDIVGGLDNGKDVAVLPDGAIVVVARMVYSHEQTRTPLRPAPHAHERSTP